MLPVEIAGNLSTSFPARRPSYICVFSADRQPALVAEGARGLTSWIEIRLQPDMNEQHPAVKSWAGRCFCSCGRAISKAFKALPLVHAGVVDAVAREETETCGCASRDVGTKRIESLPL